MDATKKRAEKLQAKGKPVDFNELLRMEPDGGTTNIRNVKSKHWTRWLAAENRCWCRLTLLASSARSKAAISGSRSMRPAPSPASPASGLNGLAREILGEVFAGDEGRRYAFPGTSGKTGGHIAQGSLSVLMGAKTTNKSNPRMGICEYLGLNDVTPHDLRRTGACILEQLGYSDGVIGRVMTHKTADKDAASVTRDHYLVPVQIIERPVDPRIKALDDLDAALREILGLPATMEPLPAPPRLLTAA